MARPDRDEAVIARRLLFWYSVRLLACAGTAGLLLAAAFTPGEDAVQMFGGAIGTGISWYVAHERLTAAIDAHLSREQA